jgi:hypothetical protein
LKGGENRETEKVTERRHDIEAGIFVFLAEDYANTPAAEFSFKSP